jgi:hypothetical protein
VPSPAPAKPTSANGMPGRGTQQQSRAGEARSHGEQHSIGQTRPDDVGQRAPAQHGRGEEARAEASDGGVGPQRSLEVYGAPCLEAPLDDEAERAQPTQHEKHRLEAEAGTLLSGPPLAAGKAVERSGRIKPAGHSGRHRAQPGWLSKIGDRPSIVGKASAAF